jgi:hypothetical protein
VVEPPSRTRGRSTLRNVVIRVLRARLLLSVGLLLATASVATSQAAPAEQRPAESSKTSQWLQFVGGAAVGFGAHESGHVVFDVIFDASPGVKRIDYAGIPFFAITHDATVSDRQEFTISSAGFWVQHATSEWILTSHPHLKDERAPFLKGWLAWNVVASGVYSVAAFGRFGPPESDTRGMATSLGVPEPWIGALIAAPAALDTWRYLHPESRWARWTSRAVKVSGVLLVIAAH